MSIALYVARTKSGQLNTNVYCSRCIRHIAHYDQGGIYALTPDDDEYDEERESFRLLCQAGATKAGVSPVTGLREILAQLLGNLLTEEEAIDFIEGFAGYIGERAAKREAGSK